VSERAEEPAGGAPRRRGFVDLFRATEIDARLVGMLGALALIWVGVDILSGGAFLTPRNLWNLSVQTASVAVMAAGMVLVIVFSVQHNWLPATGAGPGGSADWAWNWAHIRHLILPAVTMSVIPMGVIARTIRALVAEILSQDFVQALAAKGLTDRGIFAHVVKNTAPTALAVMGLQLGYLLGGSILIETVVAWPGTGFLLNAAIFQRDLPLLQGTILVLAMFFVVLNLLVDVLQTALDPRIQRS